LGNVFHQCYYHFTWSTRWRHETIDDEVRRWTVGAIENESRQRGATVQTCNAMPDHVHLFVSMPPTGDRSVFIGQVKGASAFQFNRQFPQHDKLEWQQGYAILTLRKGEAPKLIAYIDDQQRRHAEKRTIRLFEERPDD